MLLETVIWINLPEFAGMGISVPSQINAYRSLRYLALDMCGVISTMLRYIMGRKARVCALGLRDSSDLELVERDAAVDLDAGVL